MEDRKKWLLVNPAYFDMVAFQISVIQGLGIETAWLSNYELSEAELALMGVEKGRYQALQVTCTEEQAKAAVAAELCVGYLPNTSTTTDV